MQYLVSHKALGLVLLILLMSVVSHAATFTVSKTADSNDGVCDADCSLREAITAANVSPSDDIVNFDAPLFGSSQTLILSGGELVFASGTHTTVIGPGSTLLTIDGNNASRIFFISESAVIGLSGMRLTRGNGVGGFGTNNHGGAIRVFSGSLTLNDLVIAENRANSAKGGGIWVSDGSQLLISNSTFSQNVGETGAGAIDIRESQATLVGVLFTENNYGIFVGGSGSGPETSLTVQSCVFRNNISASDGAAILNFGKNVTIRDSIFSENRTGDGGTISVVNGSFIVERSSFTSNLSSFGGGGAIKSYGTLNVSDSTFIGNVAGHSRGGGAIFHRASLVTATIDRCTFQGNSTSGDGGAILNAGAGLNDAPGMVITNSLISGNSSTRSGGGVYLQGDALPNAPRTDMTNVTITQNVSGAGGGGVGVDNAFTVSLITNSTIARNRASTGTGGIKNLGAIYLRNTIVGNNEAATGEARDVSGDFYSYGYNLIRDPVGATFVGDPTGNIFGVDPLLGPLADNGGPTRTLALRIGSPAIDKGSFVNPALSIDQRGFPRPFDFKLIPNASGTGSDIGAFERQEIDVSGARLPFDYDGDGRSDPSVRRVSTNTWYLLRGTAGFTAITWGEAGDKMAPADYDGDAKTDVAVFRPSNGVWYIYMSQTQTFQQFGWGQNGDLPVPTDRDNDGRTDLVVYRESNNTWYVRYANGTFAQTQFGVAGDKPMLGDFDGDGVGDIALFRPSNNNWYIIKSSLGFFIQTWGEAGDIPTTGDFDGDGKTDQAVFRPSTGQWFLSRTTQGFSSQNWGQAGDIPVAADYDGDGKTDVAVFRPTNGTWYIVQSSNGILIQQFGINGDVPTQSAFIY